MSVSFQCFEYEVFTWFRIITIELWFKTKNRFESKDTNKRTDTLGTPLAWVLPDWLSPVYGTPSLGTPDLGTPDLGTPGLGTLGLGTQVWVPLVPPWLWFDAYTEDLLVNVMQSLAWATGDDSTNCMSNPPSNYSLLGARLAKLARAQKFIPSIIVR